MIYKPINVDFLINRITKKDRLFGGNYTIDPYQNCEFNCLYCDSSQENKIYIKRNAPVILDKELKKLKKGKIIVGSVHDPYQRIDDTELITRSLLRIIKKYKFSCHILTKSDLVLRDTDIISKIKNSSVSISFCSINKKTSAFFEENVPPPEKRLNVISKLKSLGIKTGLAIIPILPYITEREINQIIKSTIIYNADYILYKPLELKGYQKRCFLKKLEEFDHTLVEKYKKLYKESIMPEKKYLKELRDKIGELCKKSGIRYKIF
jgi:DNA repair photolyase